MSAVVRAMLETFRAVGRDRASLSTMILAVVLYSFFYPSAYLHQIAAFIPIVIVDLDHSPASRALIRKVTAVRAVSVVGQVASMGKAKQMLVRAQTQGILLISADFEHDILRGVPGRISLFANGADLTRSSAALSGISDALSGFGRDAALRQESFSKLSASAPVSLVTRPLFNTREGYGSVIVPGVAILIIQQTLLIGVGLLAGTRREQLGTLRIPTKELLGIGTAFFLIGVANLLYFVGFVFWLHDYPRGGNFAGLVAITVAFVTAVVTCALFVGSFFRVREHALQVILMVSLPVFFLANLSWPVQMTPEALRWMAKLIPSTPGINAFVKLNEMGARVNEVGPELLNLILLSSLYGGLAWVRLRARRGERANYSLAHRGSVESH